ncbi:MAG: DUF881 domain-containing protein [Bacillota bacterium]|nr:DUF881 domain-containing protein [Bacillota bacterium]
MRESSGAGMRTVVVVLVLLMAANVAMLARSLELLRFPGEITDTEIVRGGARALAGYYESTCAHSGLARNSAVRDALAKFKFEIEQAVSGEEIASAIATYGRAVQNVIEREEENQRRELVLWILSQDPAIRSVTGRTVITVARGRDGLVTVEGKNVVLSADTISRLRAEPLLAGLSGPVEVEILDGKASLIAPRTTQDALRLLQAELDNLRSALESLRRSAGYSPLEGRGIVVRVYDAPGGFSREDVVQEKDVRDMVNELFAAGAVGVEVGGQRLVATSSIRSAGPLLLVNQQPISVNPVVIHAVGDPELLTSSLELIRNSLKPWGIRVEVERQDNLVLSAFRKEGP